MLKRHLSQLRMALCQKLEQAEDENHDADRSGSVAALDDQVGDVDDDLRSATQVAGRVACS